MIFTTPDDRSIKSALVDQSETVRNYARIPVNSLSIDTNFDFKSFICQLFSYWKH
jgi:hypothetical protein